MTPLGLVPLRLAATIAHALPGAQLRLRDGDTTLLQVGPPPMPAGPAVTPCTFRRAVARAHRQIEAGIRLQFLGLGEGCTPTVDVGVRPGDCILPGGIYRVGTGDVDVYAFVTTLSPKSCRDMVANQPDVANGVLFHRDAATDVTVAHMLEPRGAGSEAPMMLQDLLVGCVADEVTGVVPSFSRP